MHVTSHDAIDYGWDLLPTVDEFLVRLKWGNDQNNGTVTRLKVLRQLAKALESARAEGWEGDFRPEGEVRVLIFPDPDSSEFKIGFVWKQDNNGTTFIAEPGEED